MKKRKSSSQKVDKELFEGSPWELFSFKDESPLELILDENLNELQKDLQCREEELCYYKLEDDYINTILLTMDELKQRYDYIQSCDSVEEYEGFNLDKEKIEMDYFNRLKEVRLEKIFKISYKELF